MPTIAELQQDLDDLYEIRRALINAISTDSKFVELEIRGRKMKYVNPSKHLETIRDEIKFLEGKIPASRSSARNQASIVRRRC